MLSSLWDADGSGNVLVLSSEVTVNLTFDTDSISPPRASLLLPLNPGRSVDD